MDVSLDHHDLPVMDRQQRLIARFLEELQEPSHASHLGALAITSGHPQGVITLFDIAKKFQHGGYNTLAGFAADMRKAVLQQYRMYGLDAPESACAEYLDDRLSTKIALWPTELKAELSLDYTRQLWQQEQGVEPSPDLGRRRSSRKSKFTLKQQYMQEVADQARIKDQSKKMQAAQEEATRQELVASWRHACHTTEAWAEARQTQLLPCILSFLYTARDVLNMADLTYEGITLGLLHCRHSPLLGRIVDTLIGGRKKDLGGWAYHQWHERLVQRVTVWYEVEVYLQEYYKWQRATEDIPPPPRKGTWRAKTGQTFGEGVNLNLYECLGETNPLLKRPYHRLPLELQGTLLYLLCQDRFEWDPKVQTVIREASPDLIRPLELGPDSDRQGYLLYREGFPGTPVLYQTSLLSKPSGRGKWAMRTPLLKIVPLCQDQASVERVISDLEDTTGTKSKQCAQTLSELLPTISFTSAATEKELFWLHYSIAQQYQRCQHQHLELDLYQ
eukprot:m.22957 g.22957  ORF g.22957 m.22957 type:complete len:503 (+) comp11310_c0_seq1:174-1682(+)